MTRTGHKASAYYGKPTHDYEARGFLLTESAYRGSEALPVHCHENAHFCLVLSGSYTERLEGREVERRPGDLIFYPAGVDHAECHHVDGRHFMIELRAEACRALAQAQRDRQGDLSWTSKRGATRSAATRVFAEFRREERAGSALMQELVERLVEAAADRESTARRAPGWLDEVEARLRKTVEGPPDLVALAREAGVHPVHLGRAFRRTYGCTPGEYLRRLRVERAQRALAEADCDLADVAYSAGFCDQSHLNRIFKRQTGVTPGRYRRLVTPEAWPG